MKKRARRMERLRAVQREFRAAQIAFDALARRLRANPSLLNTSDVRPTDLKRARANLEGTYLLRMFAEFESGLRDVWISTVRDSQPPVAVLMNSLASRRGIPLAGALEADEVRAHRNVLVHEGASPSIPIPLMDAMGRLLHFFSFMPPDW